MVVFCMDSEIIFRVKSLATQIALEIVPKSREFRSSSCSVEKC